MAEITDKEGPSSIVELKQWLGPDIADLLTFEEESDLILAKPKKYIADRGLWDELNQAVKRAGGRYIYGYASFKIPKARVSPVTPVKSEDKTVQPKQVSETPEDPRAAKSSLRAGEVQAGRPIDEKPTDMPTEVPTEPTPIHPTEEYSIKATVEKVGRLYPILVDAYRNIIDGFHRVKEDPSWEEDVRKLDYITDPVQLELARIIANNARRNVPAEEKTQSLARIAQLTGWTPKQISEATGMSYTWIMKYLPDEYKEKTWEQEPITRRVIEKEPEKFVIPGEAQFITCTNCGVATSEPLEWRGKPVCSVCYEKLSKPKDSTEGFEPTPLPPAVKGAEEKPKPTRHWIDIAEFTCKVCGEFFLVQHDEATGEHRLWKVREE